MGSLKNLKGFRGPRRKQSPLSRQIELKDQVEWILNHRMLGVKTKYSVLYKDKLKEYGVHGIIFWECVYVGQKYLSFVSTSHGKVNLSYL